jgi:hypothetical protein
VTSRRSSKAVLAPLAVLLAGAGLLSACGSGGGHAASAPARPRTLTVPGEYRTIQAAVNHAGPGDLVLISPGVYHQAVTVDVRDLVVRGTNRNTMANGITSVADGDVVENLTARHYAANGILFNGAGGYGASEAGASTAGTVLRGYRASYITAYDNGLYGIYAFDATQGEIDHAYASGQPDSGLYVGQCNPCDAVVTHSVASGNRVGFEAANASGGLTVIDSNFSANRDGVAIESSTTEQLAPQQQATVAGNVVDDNNNPRTPSEAEPSDVFGYGIAIGGGSDDTVEKNLVTGNASVGVVVTDLAGYDPKDDTVSGNQLSGNGVDIAYVIGSGGSAAAAGNCFATNTFATSTPASIQTAMACGAPATTVQSTFTPEPGAKGVDYTTLPAPPAQPQLPHATTAPARPAVDEPPRVDLSTVTVPSS